MSAESRTLDELSRTTNAKAADVTSAAAETSQLFGVCVDPIDLAAKVTGRVDLAVGSAIQSACDEALSQILETGS
jgi:hypothetical protein